MKKNIWKIVIVIVAVAVTVLLLVLSIVGVLPTQIQMNPGDALEVLVLIMVSYYLVAKDTQDSRRRDAILKLISKLQYMLSEVTDLEIDTEEQKNIIRIKYTNISNVVEILKDELPNEHKIELIIGDIDTLSSIVLDHIDDKDYIEKTNAQIYKLISNINTKLEQIAFKVV